MTLIDCTALSAAVLTFLLFVLVVGAEMVRDALHLDPPTLFSVTMTGSIIVAFGIATMVGFPWCR